MSNFQTDNHNTPSQNQVASAKEKANLLRATLDRVAVTWRLFWDKRTGLYPRLILLAGAAYLFLPIDLIPDFVTGMFGGLDDLGVITMALAMFNQAVPDDLVKAVQAEINQKRAARRGDVIDGKAH